MTQTDMLQILASGLGTLGYSMFFNVRGSRVAVNAVGAMLGWAVYLVVMKNTDSVFWSYFIAALFITFGSEILARTFRMPTTMMIVPMLFPEIPGGDLYNMAANLFQGELEAFSFYGQRLAVEIGALNLGIVLATTLWKLYMAERRYLAQRRAA